MAGKSTLFAAVVAVSLAVGCEPPPPSQTPMERWARAALNCPVGTLTWSVVDPDCGTIDAAANYTAPATCPVPYVDRTCHVQAAGCGNTATLPVQIVDNDLRGLAVYCGVVAPETCCRLPPLTVSPAAQIQFYAQLQYACAGHVVYAAAPPPPLCP